ncbi:dihydrolipoyl dehydrogenase [Rossellomorea marisflavi]|uniref:dihydrolipoyl dehydrogenase n=1 Tax=Rossellomorea marisflavi TaxID=189381 RepID=UPI0027A864CF|nr:dihydrolipoyl dehydrogenase [Rossellomorea marisflavi]UTE73725.1 dihydrolipoyl dehydrogenase [Rossellomorea marisflavi]
MRKAHLDTVIIGSGPGGYIAAIRASQLGQHVTIIEKGAIGGTCLHSGCIPSKSLITISKKWADLKKNEALFGKPGNNRINFEEFTRLKHSTINKLHSGIKHLLAKNRITVLEGEAFFSDNSSLTVTDSHGDTHPYSFNHCIIATGSKPRLLPDLPWSNRILSSTSALDLKRLPTSISIVGGGYIGVELGCAYANLGVNVTIIEAQDDILPFLDADIRTHLKKHLVKKGVRLLTGATISEWKEDDESLSIHVEKKEEAVHLQPEYVIVSAGRVPRSGSLGLHHTDIVVDENGFIEVDQSLRTGVPTIFAIGDVIKGAALAHKASYDGKLVAEVISGNKYSVDYKAMPQVIFSDPEIALTGKTQTEEGIKQSTFPLGANGRALTMGEEGMVRIYFHEQTGQLQGAAVIGPHSSEIITEITVAIEAGWTVEDLSLTIHPHPTISESIMEAAELASGMPVHVSLN